MANPAKILASASSARMTWPRLLLLPFPLLLAAAAGQAILPAAPFPNSVLIVLALFLFARNYLSVEASPFDVITQIRRFRRSGWLLIPLAALLFGLRQLMETAPAMSNRIAAPRRMM